MGIKKEKNAISWSKGDINEFSKGKNNNKMCDFVEYDINEFSKGKNNNKMCDFVEYDIFTVQHWDFFFIYYHMECKVNLSVS